MGSQGFAVSTILKLQVMDDTRVMYSSDDNAEDAVWQYLVRESFERRETKMPERICELPAGTYRDLNGAEWTVYYVQYRAAGTHHSSHDEAMILVHDERDEASRKYDAERTAIKIERAASIATARKADWDREFAKAEGGK